MNDNDENQLSWEQYETCLIGSSPEVSPSSKVASFDLDLTLVKPKNWSKFAENVDDWTFLYDSVRETILQLAADNFKIVIFMNQKGISMGKVHPEDVKTKVTNIAKALRVRIQVFVSI